MTTTTTKPDGTVVVVRTSDPKVVKALERVVSRAAAAGIQAQLENNH